MINKARILLILSSLIIVLSGCSMTPERKPIPVDLVKQAAIPSIPDARFWADEWPTFSVHKFENLTDKELREHFSAIYNTEHNYLAISGGGANGAFGAGLLAGWTEHGERPQFTMVTGVSTGALSAPFAFLGSDYDDELKKVYTQTKTSDIAVERNLLSGMLGDSMADTTPLKKLIRKYITDDVIAAIGREYKKGRRLFVGTVNLDAGRAVIWNIGAIANSNYPEKADLIREVLRASAAIPVAFPPVLFNVEADGKTYDEMHVDGGTGSQVFVYPAAVNWKQITKKLKVKGKPKVYIIRNSFLDLDYNGVIPSVMPIASRSIDSLIRTQGVGDLYQIYALCERDGNDFNLAYIPADFTEKPKKGFDPVYMTDLYNYAYKMAVNGFPWKKGPPGFIRK